jgi:hypothetical protein
MTGIPIESHPDGGIQRRERVAVGEEEGAVWSSLPSTSARACSRLSSPIYCSNNPRIPFHLSHLYLVLSQLFTLVDGLQKYIARTGGSSSCSWSSATDGRPVTPAYQQHFSAKHALT